MNEISPTYYAAQSAVGAYVLEGEGFSRIPSDAVGLLAYSNDGQLAYINDTNPIHLYNVTVESEKVIIANPKQIFTLSRNAFLGAIVSADRNTIYWINETNPLP